jgi:hypothetical protein
MVLHLEGIQLLYKAPVSMKIIVKIFSLYMVLLDVLPATREPGFC